MSASPTHPLRPARLSLLPGKAQRRAFLRSANSSRNGGQPGPREASLRLRRETRKTRKAAPVSSPGGLNNATMTHAQGCGDVGFRYHVASCPNAVHLPVRFLHVSLILSRTSKGSILGMFPLLFFVVHTCIQDHQDFPTRSAAKPLPRFPRQRREPSMCLRLSRTAQSMPTSEPPHPRDAR